MGEKVRNGGHHKRRGNQWEKLDGGVKEVFAHVKIREFNAACDRFLAEREPNHAANKARAKNLIGGKFRGAFLEKGGEA